MTHTNGKPRLVSLFLVALVFGGSPLQIHADERTFEPAARVLPEKPQHTVLEAYHRHDLIFVKFLDESSARVADGRIASDDRVEQAEISSRTDSLFEKGASVEPMIDEAPGRLREQRDNAIQNLGRDVADLTKWFIIRLPELSDTANWIDALNQMDSVEIALPAPLPPPLPSCETSSCVHLQDYLVSPSSTPRGVNAEAVWNQYGVAGDGIRVSDIEYAFLPHNDLPPIAILLENDTSHWQASHGTAMLGIMRSIDNSFGTTGIAHAAFTYFASSTQGGTWNICQAINSSISALQVGDVIVIQQQFPGPAGETTYVPIEWYQPWYDCVVNAVGNGYIVVMAAGNGAQDLDSSIFDSGHKPFLAQNDSGSIIVGAGHPLDQNRMSFSTYGSRVNVQGWGVGVFTTEPINTFAYSDGTSSATAIVGGVSALIQSAYKSQTGKVATPAEMRNALLSGGTPQGSGGHIGPLPNALEAVRFLINVPDNYTVLSWSCWGMGEAFWNSVPGATYYELQRSTNPYFPPSQSSIYYSGSATWTQVNVGESTYFRVRACNGSTCWNHSPAELLTYLNGCV